jgi:hypothetical protein
MLTQPSCIAIAVVKVVGILVAKADTDPDVGHVLADVFDWRDDVGSRAREIFGTSTADTSLLKQAYFAASRVNAHFDYDAAAFGLGGTPMQRPATSAVMMILETTRGCGFVMTTPT